MQVAVLQPLSPRGVAGLATAPVWRVIWVALVYAMVLAVVFAWFVNNTWFPQVQQAIRNLPAKGEVRDGKLTWGGDSPVQLAGSRFLAIAIDLHHEAELGHESDVCVKLGRTDMRIYSLPGYWPIGYPKGWRVALDRMHLEAWWNAWSPVVQACAALGCICVLLLAWAALAAVYSAPVLLLAFFANRRLNFSGALKLALAAQMPGALLLGIGVLLYGHGLLDVIQFCMCVPLQAGLVWIHLLISLLFVARLGPTDLSKGNPFAAPSLPDAAQHFGSSPDTRAQAKSVPTPPAQAR